MFPRCLCCVAWKYEPSFYSCFQASRKGTQSCSFPTPLLEEKTLCPEGKDLLKASHFSVKTHSKRLDSCCLQKCQCASRNPYPCRKTPSSKECADGGNPFVARAQAQIISFFLAPSFSLMPFYIQPLPKRPSPSPVISRA